MEQFDTMPRNDVEHRTTDNKSAVISALTRIEKNVAPVVVKSTEQLVDQYQDTLRKLARR